MARDDGERFHFTAEDWRAKRLGPRVVEDEVGGRLLAFEEEAVPVKGGSVFFIHVLTMPTDEMPSRKLVSLAVTKEAMQQALDAVEVRET